MMSDSLETTLHELEIADLIKETEELALLQAIAMEAESARPYVPEMLPRLGFLYESQGVKFFQNWLFQQDEMQLEKAQDCFQSAFVCWRAIATLPNGDKGEFDNGVSSYGIEILESELVEFPLPTVLTLAFRIGVSGILGNRTAETRLELERFNLGEHERASRWKEHVIQNVFAAFVRLVRKGGDWEDIDIALYHIGELRQLQEAYETDYIESLPGSSEKTFAAMELVGLYNLAQSVTLVGDYLSSGQPALRRLNIGIDRHREQANSAFQAAGLILLQHLTDLIWLGCRELARNAIWSHVDVLGEAIQNFARLLADRGKPHPVIELWSSQQIALRSNLLDVYRRALLVEMPTSAGKTLLAEFVIVQTKALNPAGKIAYVVPTRALVNQVTRTLRADFRQMQRPRLVVEQAVPAFQLDPTEDQLLQSDLDILVTTPEKLDLLIRKDHPSTENLVLVIADEAHNLQEGERGARLELLLGTIKREKANARFLLLSPFLPNGQELVQWLGEDRYLDPIVVNWKPAKKLVGAVDFVGTTPNRRLVFETLSAADNTDVSAGRTIAIGPGLPSSEGRSIYKLTRETVKTLLDRGSILILCRGPGGAMTRAADIAPDLPRLSANRYREAIIHYIEAEVGRKSSLAGFLDRGVAYHHAGLSHETRWLVESLVRRGDTKVVCGTTTLAQGINFPIATVIIETLQKGGVPLNYQDFWNIAGRAGRTLVDVLGIVAFPTGNKQKRIEIQQFLQGEALEISSQLAEIISNVDEIGEQFDLKTIMRFPQLSSLLQFLAHAMRVSGGHDLADELDDILRASLVYHQAQKRSTEDVRKLLRLCRAYLGKARTQRGILSLADQTGFATPSVLHLRARTDGDPEFTEPENWTPERLFGEDIGPLTQRIEAIANLPEIRLGQETRPPFNAQLVAEILRDWVQGENLDYLAAQHLRSEETDPDKRVAEFSKYLFSRLLGLTSWGMGALETVSLAGKEPQVESDIGYVPSMVFFGVQEKEAIWLRMTGVPRVAAEGLGQTWKTQRGQAPTTYDDLRTWVSGLSDEDWRSSLPQNTQLSPEDMRLIWSEFSG